MATPSSQLFSTLGQISEFCGGGDLASYNRKNVFNKDDYIRVMLELLSAFAYLHELNISHRDLRPQNVTNFSLISLILINNFNWTILDSSSSGIKQSKNYRDGAFKRPSY